MYSHFSLEHDGSKNSAEVMAGFADLLEKRPEWQNPGISALADVSGTCEPKGKNQFSIETEAPIRAVAIQLQSLCRHYATDLLLTLEGEDESLTINRWGMVKNGKKRRTTSFVETLREMNASLVLCPPEKRKHTFREIFRESEFTKRALAGLLHRNLCLVHMDNGWRLILNDGLQKVFGALRHKMTLLPSSSQSESREILAGIYDTEKDFDGRGFTIARAFQSLYPEKSEELLGLALS